MTPKEKLEVIRQYIPGTYEELAIKVPCHVQTIHNLKAGKAIAHDGILKGLDKLYQKALEVQAVMEK
jgi:hypothetical protein